MITSKDNKIIKLINGLIKEKKIRDKENLFVIEGIKAISEINSDFSIKYIVISEDFQKRIDMIIPNLNKNVLESILCVVSSNVFSSLSSMKTPEGILAVLEKKDNKLYQLENKNVLKFVLLDSIQDPGNLGTIIRSADAFGMDAVILTKNTVDLYSPKVTRSTMGSMFHLPIIVNTEIDEFIDWCKKNNIKIYATDLKTNTYMDQIKLEDKSCIVIGNEAHGVCDEILNNADERFKIKMNGNAESLNAGIAASVIMYEMLK